MEECFQKYLEYITNTGGSPTIEQFDNDWEPIGHMVRRDMKLNMLIYEKEGQVRDYSQRLGKLLNRALETLSA